MRTASSKWLLTLILTILCFSVFFLTEGYSQTHPIVELKFVPPDPHPGSTLRLYISLSPLEQKQDVAISLITWRDLNDDCKYTENGEQVKHPVIKVKDNEEGKDEESFEDEIMVRIYDVPLDHPPQKYTAIVTYGRDSKSESVVVPSRKKVICNPTNTPSNWSFRKVLSTPYEVAKKLRILKNVLKRAGIQGEYQGAHSLYLYTLKGKKLERIIHGADTFYLSPTWSFDSEKISFVANQGSKKKIAWIDIEDKNLQIVTEGPDDRDPFWLPDDTRIVFVRDNRLQVVDRRRKEIKAIAKDIRVDRILGVSQGTENTVQVIYEAPNPYTNETTEVYILELDTRLKRKSVSQLVNNPIWFLITAVSPSGNQVVYSEKNNLFISLINGKQVKRLFKDEHHYYEPSWSPDGDEIVFVSDRSE